MDDFFASKLSQGPLGNMLSTYKKKNKEVLKHSHISQSQKEQILYKDHTKKAFQEFKKKVKMHLHQRNPSLTHKTNRH